MADILARTAGPGAGPGRRNSSRSAAGGSEPGLGGSQINSLVMFDAIDNFRESKSNDDDELCLASKAGPGLEAGRTVFSRQVSRPRLTLPSALSKGVPVSPKARTVTGSRETGATSLEQQSVVVQYRQYQPDLSVTLCCRHSGSWAEQPQSVVLGLHQGLRPPPRPAHQPASPSRAWRQCQATSCQQVRAREVSTASTAAGAW